MKEKSQFYRWKRVITSKISSLCWLSVKKSPTVHSSFVVLNFILQLFLLRQVIDTNTGGRFVWANQTRAFSIKWLYDSKEKKNQPKVALILLAFDCSVDLAVSEDLGNSFSEKCLPLFFSFPPNSWSDLTDHWLSSSRTEGVCDGLQNHHWIHLSRKRISNYCQLGQTRARVGA